MKSTPNIHSIIALVALTLAIFLIGCASTPKPATAPSDETRIYEIFGMDCPGCHGGVENLVREVDGVVDAEASWQDKRLKVMVAVGADPSDDAIGDAIARANFTLGKRLK